MRILTALPALLVGLLAAPAAAEDVRFSITPYLWLPTVEGDFRYGIPPGAEASPDVSVGPVDYLDSLEGVFMIAGEARFGRFGAFTDFIYLDFSTDDANIRTLNGPGPLEIPLELGTEVDLSGTMWTLAGGYDVIENEDVRLQAFAGIRYLGIDSSLAWELSGPLDVFPQTGSVGRDSDAWDGLVGARGEFRTGDWFFPYYADIGGGDSELTWQALVGVGYRFGWGDLRLDYRYLNYEQDEDQLVQDLTLAGPSFGATFRF
jgi:hypothetical protein